MVALATLVAVSGCVGAPGPAPATVPGAGSSAEAAATSTPAAAAPSGPAGSGSASAASPADTLGQGQPTAHAEREGLTVELWLDHDQVHIGDRVTALARISNRGDGTVTWETNVCGYGPAPVVVDRERASSPYPADDGVANEFRRQVLDLRPYFGRFLDVSTIDVGNFACPAFSAPRPFKPGDSAEMRVAWDARDTPGIPVSPGPATARATFSSGRWVRQGRRKDRSRSFPRPRPSRSTARRSGAHPLSDYVDAALGNAQFRDWLNRQPIDQWINPSVEFWPGSNGQYPADPIYAGLTNGAVDIALYVAAARTGAITFDASTLHVLGIRLDE